MPATAVPPRRKRRSAAAFGFIEHRYGRPVGEWVHIVSSSPLERHMQLVAMLKEEHGMRHGHADAIVAHALRDRR